MKIYVRIKKRILFLNRITINSIKNKLKRSRIYKNNYNICKINKNIHLKKRERLGNFNMIFLDFK